ncbi:MAG: hypothetical protein ACRDT5_13350 [Mycobacterium sp.]
MRFYDKDIVAAEDGDDNRAGDPQRQQVQLVAKTPMCGARIEVVGLPAALTAPDLTHVDGRSHALADQSRKSGLLSQFQRRHQPGR